MVDTVALVGDSIRMGYQPYVAVRVRTHSVWGPAENCRSSRFLSSHLEELVLEHLHEPTLIHINAGAHDLRREEPDGFEVQVPLAEYRTNLESIIRRLKVDPRVAAIVVATTTPVDDIRHKTGDSMRYNEDVIAYNEALVDVAAANRCFINDLYDEVRKCRFDPLSEDGIHFNETGKEYLGASVARYLRQALAI